MTNNTPDYDTLVANLEADATPYRWTPANGPEYHGEDLAITDNASGRMIWSVRGNDLTPAAWIGNDGTILANGQTTYLKPLLRGRKVRKGYGMSYLAEHRNPRTRRMINPNGKVVRSACPMEMIYRGAGLGWGGENHGKPVR